MWYYHEARVGRDGSVPRDSLRWSQTFRKTHKRDQLGGTTPRGGSPRTCDLDLLLWDEGPTQNLERSEDCQRLTVTVPQGTVDTAKRLEVIVWIHGGSFLTGSGEMPAYDAQTLASERNRIVVSLSYHVGLFGFMGDGKDRDANLGLFDLIEGLRWVQRNIAAFGGNPEPRRITVIGQSARGSALAD